MSTMTAQPRRMPTKRKVSAPTEPAPPASAEPTTDVAMGPRVLTDVEYVFVRAVRYDQTEALRQHIRRIERVAAALDAEDDGTKEAFDIYLRALREKLDRQL